MIEKLDNALFKKHISTLKDTSLDDNGVEYLTDSKLPAIKFDDVKREFRDIHKIHPEPSSNDALFWNKDGRIIFIEFKNSPLKNLDRKNTKTKIWNKIYDSVIIFSHIVGLGISEMCEQVEYVLVYNNNAECVETQERDNIAKTFSQKAKEKILPLELHKFKGFCFKDVDVYSKADFENFLHSL